METPITEVKSNIAYHRRSVRWLGVGMWAVVVLALITHVIITSMMDAEINKLAAVINIAVQSGISDAPKDPAKLAYAGRDNNMGWLVLAMFFSVLLAILGKMRFHLKELSTNESRLFDLSTLQAVNSDEIDSDIKSAVIAACFSSSQKNDPIISIGTEAISKISDGVAKKIGHREN